jgi:hypothetical protein
MNRDGHRFCFLITTLMALAGCSSGPSSTEPKQAAIPLDKIQGKAQLLQEAGGATDAALNAGGSNVYLWQGIHRYRLFLRKPAEIVHGKQYIAEGVYVQKAIDEIGDPDQGKNGYPLDASCERVVRKAWNNLSFDEVDPTVSLVRARVKRYPARPLFLVTRIQPAPDADASAAAKKDAAVDGENITEVEVPADKQAALLISGPKVQTAPLWDPTGGTVRCKVVISSEGKIADLESGTQLCEAVPWDEFRYQPPVKNGHPVKVSTEVEVKFDPRK